MKTAVITVTHPIFGEINSGSIDTEEEKDFLSTVINNFKKGKIEYLEFNKTESTTSKSYTILPEHILNESILTINYYEK